MLIRNSVLMMSESISLLFICSRSAAAVFSRFSSEEFSSATAALFAMICRRSSSSCVNGAPILLVVDVDDSRAAGSGTGWDRK